MMRNSLGVLLVVLLAWVIPSVISFMSSKWFCHTPMKATATSRRLIELVDESMLDTSQTFASFAEIPVWLQEACQKIGFNHPTEAQRAAIPVIFEGKDVILQAQTGSGKTLVYALPILSKIDIGRRAIQAVIVVPTRELGLQVAGVLKQLAANCPEKLQIMPLVEGSNNRRQQLWATAEPPHIVVGNPRSLQKLVDNGRLRLNSVNFIVIDEVDACLLKAETKKELHTLLSKHLSNTYQEVVDDEDTNKELLRDSLVYKDLAKDVREAELYRNTRQAIFCSATIPQRKYFAESCHKNGWTEQVPELINISDLQLLPNTIEHESLTCDIDSRLKMTAYLLKQEILKHGIQNLDNFQCLVFVDDEEKADKYQATLNMLLQKIIHDAESEVNGSVLGENIVEALLSTRNIDNRRQVLSSFKQGTCKVLLCSDIASRGIDIPNNRVVIQMSLPKTAEDYLHRAGRTGRLGRHGKVITLHQEEEEFVLKRYSNELGISIKKRVLVSKRDKGQSIE